jgi:hypothetical protein
VLKKGHGPGMDPDSARSPDFYTDSVNPLKLWPASDTVHRRYLPTELPLINGKICMRVPYMASKDSGDKKIFYHL